MNKHKHKKIIFEKYNIGDLVELTEDKVYYFWNEWSAKNGRIPNTGKFISSKTQGKFIKLSPESGNLYNIIDVDGELFEVFHKNVRKILRNEKR